MFESLSPMSSQPEVQSTEYIYHLTQLYLTLLNIRIKEFREGTLDLVPCEQNLLTALEDASTKYQDTVQTLRSELSSTEDEHGRLEKNRSNLQTNLLLMREEMDRIKKLKEEVHYNSNQVSDLRPSRTPLRSISSNRRTVVETTKSCMGRSNSNISRKTTISMKVPAKQGPKSRLNDSKQEASSFIECIPPAPLLSDKQIDFLEMMKTNLLHKQPKNVFSRKIIKLLTTGFNLKETCHEMLTRGVIGIPIMRGSRLPTGYSGSKKLSPLSIWQQFLSGKCTDLEKFGFSSRVLRVSCKTGTFELINQSKLKRQRSTSPLGERRAAKETSTVDSLMEFTFNLEEITKQVLSEQLGRQDTQSSLYSEKDRKVLRTCSIYSVEALSRDSTHTYQFIFESVQSILDFIVSGAALGLI